MLKINNPCAQMEDTDNKIEHDYDDLTITHKNIAITNEIQSLNFQNGAGSTEEKWAVDAATHVPIINTFNLRRKSARSLIENQSNTNLKLAMKELTTNKKNQTGIEGVCDLKGRPNYKTKMNNPSILQNVEDMVESINMFHNHFYMEIYHNDELNLYELIRDIESSLIMPNRGIKIKISDYPFEGIQEYLQIEDNCNYRPNNIGPSLKLLVFRNDTKKHNLNLFKTPQNHRRNSILFNINYHETIKRIVNSAKEMEANGGKVGRKIFMKNATLINCNATFIRITSYRYGQNGVTPDGHLLYDTAFNVLTQSWEQGTKDPFFVKLYGAYYFNQDWNLINNDHLGIEESIAVATTVIEETGRLIKILKKRDDIDQNEQDMIEALGEDLQFLTKYAKGSRYVTKEIIGDNIKIKEISPQPIYKNEFGLPLRGIKHTASPPREINHYAEIFGQESDDDNDDNQSEGDEENEEEDKNDDDEEEETSQQTIIKHTPHQPPTRSPSPPSFPQQLSKITNILLDASNNDKRNTGLCELAQFDPTKSNYDIKTKNNTENLLFFDMNKKQIQIRFQCKLFGSIAKKSLNELKEKRYHALAYEDEVICILPKDCQEQMDHLLLLVSNLNDHILKIPLIKSRKFNYYWICKYIQSLQQHSANLKEIHKLRYPFVFQLSDERGQNRINIVAFVSKHSSIIILNCFDNQVTYDEIKLAVTTIKEAYYAEDDVLFVLDTRIMRNAKVGTERLTFNRYCKFLFNQTAGTGGTVFKIIYDRNNKEKYMKTTRVRTISGHQLLSLHKERVYLDKEDKQHKFLYPLISD